MAIQPDTTTGTLTTTSGSVNFTTVGTQLLAREHLPGDRFLVNGLELQIATITGENAGTLTEPCPPEAAVSGFPVRLRWQPDGARVAAQTRNLIDLLGNGTLQSLAGIDGNADELLMFIGPNTLATINRRDLVEGVNYNVQVNTLPDRSAYDAEAAGFSVLVSDVGDGRAAIYIKKSATSGDWSLPAYITGNQGIQGETGPAPDLAAGTTNTVTPTTPANVTVSPDGSGGYLLNFDIPQGLQGIQGEQGNGLEIGASGILSERDLYDSEPEGFIFLDTTNGDIYIREGAAGNWSDPITFAGPPGADGSTITTTNGTGNGSAGPYTINQAPIGLDNVISASISGVLQYNYTIGGTGPYTITFGIPVPTGVAWQVKQSGPLSIGSADSVVDGAINAAAITNDPAQQELIRDKLGVGVGAGDVFGPSSSVNNRIAVFDGTTGKLIKDGGQTIAEIASTGSVPLGTPMPIITNTLPGGYLWLEGGTYDPLVYPEFNTFMVTAGYASGALPDWRNRVLRGLGTLTGALGSLQADALQEHSHNITYAQVATDAGVGAGDSHLRTYSGAGLNVPAGPVLTGTAIAAETRVKAVIVRWAIKAYGAVTDPGTVDIVALEQGLTHAIRDDQDQLAQAKSSAFKINILKNILQSWEDIGNRVTLTGATEFTWTGLSGFSEIDLDIWYTPSVSGSALVGQVSSDNGQTYIQNLYSTRQIYAIQTTITSGDTAPLQQYLPITGATTSNIVDAHLKITRFNKALAQRVIMEGYYIEAGGSDVHLFRTGYVQGAAIAKNALRIAPLSGTITGQAQLRGRRG